MAQAARLSLRMQKEFKLLMTDPPPGVSLPLISGNDDNFSSSLSSFEARIEGPDGTVYAKGVFNLKIQIPERYPFQPPNVTFVTPIYHPNIDNGGRICLDILNLPPKGAWQPSLNISTVLTSIGLLLGEPNPDDGLMAETSREYKYNRQAFDQKARSWTEKYAFAGASERSDDCSTSASQSMMETKKPEATSEKPNNENEGSRKKLRLIGEKLSLKSTTVARTCTDNKENLAPIQHLSKSCLQNCPSILSSTMMSHPVTNYEGKLRDEDEKITSNENHKQDLGGSRITETVIVSDSEDSNEDSRNSRSRVSVMRKLKLGRRI